MAVTVPTGAPAVSTICMPTDCASCLGKGGDGGAAKQAAKRSKNELH